jgi:hypothetical protein
MYEIDFCQNDSTLDISTTRAQTAREALKMLRDLQASDKAIREIRERGRHIFVDQLERAAEIETL